MVFRHRARAQHRGLDKSDPREVCNETSPQLRKNGDSPRPTRRSPLPLAARPVPTRRRSVPTGNTTAPTGNATGRLGPPVSKRRLGFTHERLGPPGATRGTAWAPRAATRRGDSGTREAPRGGEGGDSLRPVARAGADSPLRDAPRHYRVRRHYLRGPFLQPIRGQHQPDRFGGHFGTCRQNSFAKTGGVQGVADRTDRPDAVYFRKSSTFFLARHLRRSLRSMVTRHRACRQ